MQKCNRPTSTGMEAHPARTLGWNMRKRERVRCSSLVGPSREILREILVNKGCRASLQLRRR
jgi:hypothetical protein